MRINSDYRDFYDYVVGIVGVDADRNFFRITKEIVPVENEIKEKTLALLRLCESGYTTQNFKNGKMPFDDFKELVGFVDEDDDRSFNSRYAGVFYNVSALHNIDHLITNLLDKYASKVTNGLRIHPAILVFGSKINNCFVVERNHFSDGNNSRNVYEPIVTINNLLSFLSGEDFKKMRGINLYEKLIVYLKYLIHIGNLNGFDINGEIPFGEFQDFLGIGSNERADYNRSVESPISLIIYSKTIRESRYKAPTVMRYNTIAYDDIYKNEIIKIVTNPLMISSGLQMLMCPMQAYQDIDMAVSEMNNVEKEVDFTDDVIIESKGFDTKTSFRKSKTKK